jgi:asparagine synthase (glutamine-hydrolysing)
LTNCDGESLIHLYNKGGIQFMCENLYGVFAFILFDSNLKKVFFGRDTFGVRPAFKLTTKSNILAVCSEAKGLLNLKLKSETEPKVEMVEPGTYEEYNLIDHEVNRHQAIFVGRNKFHVIGTFPKYDVNVKLGNDFYENIRNTLTNAVKMRLMSHRRIGCLLSGGLDSSLVSGLMVQEARKAGINYPIQTFSIGIKKKFFS